MENQNQNQNMNMNQNVNPADYLASISPVAPEPVNNASGFRPKKGLIWIILSAVAVFALAVTIIILSVVNFSGETEGEEDQEDSGMFEVVTENEQLPNLGAEYAAIGTRSEGMVAAIRKSDGKTVFLDDAGGVKFVLGDEYGLSAYEFHDGRIPVQCTKDNNEVGFGYLDTNGELVIACQYSYATSFENGKAQIIIRSSQEGSDFINVIIGEINTNGEMTASENRIMNASKEVTP